jgi:hypothetical protein
MRSLGGSRFEKKRCCLSSDILSSYHRFDLTAEQKPRIASHLASCAAELTLLSRHPAVEQFVGRYDVAAGPRLACDGDIDGGQL